MLGEEYGDGGAADAAVRWILDPIDGTVNYLYGLPQYAVSLAAEVDGAVVAGVVVNAATGAEWTATLGGGAWRDGRRLAGSDTATLDQTLVGTGFGYDAARRVHQGAVLAGLIGRVRDIRRFGAAALDLCLVAEGTLDAYYEKGLNPWDHAAGGLVCHRGRRRRRRTRRCRAGCGSGHRGPTGAVRTAARRVARAGRERRALTAQPLTGLAQAPGGTPARPARPATG